MGPYEIDNGYNFTLIPDNDRPCTSSNYFENNNINVLPRPVKPPDLDPIERMGYASMESFSLENAQREPKKCFYGAPGTLGINKLTVNIPRRCREIVNNRGGGTSNYK